MIFSTNKPWNKNLSMSNLIIESLRFNLLMISCKYKQIYLQKMWLKLVLNVINNLYSLKKMFRFLLEIPSHVYKLLYKWCNYEYVVFWCYNIVFQIFFIINVKCWQFFLSLLGLGCVDKKLISNKWFSLLMKNCFATK